jgi:hypothetical protein
MVNKSKYLTPLALLMGLVSGIVIAFLLSSGAFADKCIRCSANGGDGGDSGDGGKAIAGDVGHGGSCLAIIIGDSCGGSTGSNEPRGGEAGDGGDGGDAFIFGEKFSANRNISSLNNSSETN